MAEISEGSAGGMHDVEVVRTFNVAVERAWRAWSDSDEVKKWWGPIGFTCPVAEMDLREGGRSLVAMRAPAEFGGGDMYSTWAYTEVVPGHRFAYTFNFADPEGNRLEPAALGMPDGVPADGRHVVTFVDRGEGHTQVTVVEHGYTSAAARDLSQAGLEQCLDKMATSFS